MTWWLQYLLMIINGNPYIVTPARFQETIVKGENVDDRGNL